MNYILESLITDFTEMETLSHNEIGKSIIWFFIYFISMKFICMELRLIFMVAVADNFCRL